MTTMPRPQACTVKEYETASKEGHDIWDPDKISVPGIGADCARAIAAAKPRFFGGRPIPFIHAGVRYTVQAAGEGYAVESYNSAGKLTGRLAPPVCQIAVK